MDMDLVVTGCTIGGGEWFRVIIHSTKLGAQIVCLNTKQICDLSISLLSLNRTNFDEL